MEFYPFVKFENRADSIGGKWLAVESLASATVAEQAQGGHYRLFSLFEVDEIEFAKDHCVFSLRDVGCSVVAVDVVNGVVGDADVAWGCRIRIRAIVEVDC